MPAPDRGPASCTGNFSPISMMKNTTAGSAIIPTLMLHGVVGAIVSIEIVISPASTSPPGQPACRMFSHLVFSRLKIVATTGLM